MQQVSGGESIRKHIVDIGDPLPVCPCCGSALLLVFRKRRNNPISMMYAGATIGLFTGLLLTPALLVIFR